jgi:hypothetical protein
MNVPALPSSSGPSLPALQDQLKSDLRKLVRDQRQQPPPTIVPDTAIDQMRLLADRLAIEAAQLATPRRRSVEEPRAAEPAVAPVSGVDRSL